MAVKFKAALFYNDAIVFYSVYHVGENYYKARLDNCTMDNQPPVLLELYRQESYWTSNCSENMLVAELGAAIEQQRLNAAEAEM